MYQIAPLPGIQHRLPPRRSALSLAAVPRTPTVSIPIRFPDRLVLQRLKASVIFQNYSSFVFGLLSWHFYPFNPSASLTWLESFPPRLRRRAELLPCRSHARPCPAAPAWGGLHGVRAKCPDSGSIQSNDRSHCLRRWVRDFSVLQALLGDT